MSILTIVTVVKDDHAGLDRTLASIASQEDVNPGDVEVVVIDGPSPPLEVVSPEATAATVHHEPPKGIYAAMNSGLEWARGTYVYFLNAGDTFVKSTVLEHLVRALRSSPAQWAYGAVEFLDPHGKHLDEPQWSYEDERHRLFARGVFPAHQGTVARAQALRQLGGFDETYLVAADYKMMLALSLVGTPAILPWPIASFTQGGTSTTQWNTALREFHRARVEIFHPQGRTRLLEWIDTVRHSVQTVAHRIIGSIRR